MKRRSIGLRLSIGIVLVVVAVALAVGWQLVVVADLRPVAAGLTGMHWLLLILGWLFFTLLIVGLLLFCIWLVREMRHNQRQQDFLDTVTHEMKTPLAALRLFVDTLGRHQLPEERRQAFLEKMGEDLSRLERTVDQVLAAARAEARTRSPRLERVELTELLEACVEEVRARHRLAASAIRLEAPARLAARGDAEELGLVFRNLLENAVKYSPVPVEVTVVATATQERRARVEISDRGIGIPPRELRKIFLRFYRAGRDVQRQVAGLGLGLFIVRQLVRRQGGSVVARSEGQGRGSRFVVTLRAPEVARHAERPASALPADA
ncbi:MAG: HAMP domain-containing sensor histidine kinase [Myxococcota bacterium]